MNIRLFLSSIVAAFFFTACASATSDSGGDKASVVQAKQSDVQDTEMTQASETEPDQIKTEGTLGNIISGMNINTGSVNSITATEYFDTSINPDKKPIIICEHGLSGSKADYQTIAEVFAGNGYYVLTPDAYLHGDRTEGDARTVVEAAVITSGEIDTLLDYCKELPFVDINRIGLIGFSMGGMVCYDYIAHGSYQIDAACVVCTTPDWEELIGNAVAYSQYVHGETSMVLTPWGRAGVDRFIRAHSPEQELLSRSTGTDYLIISGKDDTLMPFAGSVDFYTRMKNQGEDVTMQLVEGHGHEVTQEDALDITQFMLQRLVID